MNPINDDELRAHLARRSAETLTTKEREALLGAIAAARVSARTWTFRPAFVLAPLAAAVVLVILLYPLLLTITSGPAPSASPSALITSGPAPSASPSAPNIYSAQQLSDMIGDPAWLDHYVLAQAQIGNMMSGLPCTAPDPCEIATLAGLSPGSKNVVLIAWRDAPMGEGVPIAGPRRVEQLVIPRQPGVFVFKVLTDAVEYLGPLRASDGEIAWTVDAVQAGNHDEITDDLFVVDGWLVQTYPVPCRAPSDSGADVSTEYWCGGGSFLTQQRLPTKSGNEYYLDLPGLHVQAAAYGEFALSTGTDSEGGTVPSLGHFLVRSADCPPAVWGDCPVWRMVGRLDGAPQPAPTAIATPSLEPSLSPITVLDADQLATLIEDSGSAGRVVVADVRVVPQPRPSFGAQPCVPPDACPVGQLGDIPNEIDVYSGWRDARDEGSGSPFGDDDWRWLVRLETPPIDKHVMAFRIRADSVEYLGPLEANASGLVWSVTDMPSVDHLPGLDLLYAVDGRLVHGAVISCPGPAATGPVDLNYYCIGSFITGSPTVAAGLDPGGLHVQWNGYEQFAPDPSQNSGNGTAPRRGIYLVRAVGHRSAVVGADTSAWRLLGRLAP